jgi:hypothetical protein
MPHDRVHGIAVLRQARRAGGCTAQSLEQRRARLFRLVSGSPSLDTCPELAFFSHTHAVGKRKHAGPHRLRKSSPSAFIPCSTPDPFAYTVSFHCWSAIVLLKMLDVLAIARLRYMQTLTAISTPITIATAKPTPIHTPTDTAGGAPSASLQEVPENPAAQLHAKPPLAVVVQEPPFSHAGLQKDVARGLLQSFPSYCAVQLQAAVPLG